jgi:hypothetical protein
MSIKLPYSSSGSREREKGARLLNQKKGPDAVMVGVLVAALILGLIGLAVHVLWIASIIVMALGLGFAVANRRRDRVDVTNRRADRQDADIQEAESAAGPSETARPPSN